MDNHMSTNFDINCNIVDNVLKRTKKNIRLKCNASDVTAKVTFFQLFTD